MHNFQNKQNTRCIWNCQEKLGPEERTLLEAEVECPDCTESELMSASYSWSIEQTHLTTRLTTQLTDAQWSSSMISGEFCSTSILVNKDVTL